MVSRRSGERSGNGGENCCYKNYKFSYKNSLLLPLEFDKGCGVELQMEATTADVTVVVVVVFGRIVGLNSGASGLRLEVTGVTLADTPPPPPRPRR